MIYTFKIVFNTASQSSYLSLVKHYYPSKQHFQFTSVLLKLLTMLFCTPPQTHTHLQKITSSLFYFLAKENP